MSHFQLSPCRKVGSTSYISKASTRKCANCSNVFLLPSWINIYDEIYEPEKKHSFFLQDQDVMFANIFLFPCISSKVLNPHSGIQSDIKPLSSLSRPFQSSELFILLNYLAFWTFQLQLFSNIDLLSLLIQKLWTVWAFWIPVIVNFWHFSNVWSCWTLSILDFTAWVFSSVWTFSWN